MSGFNTKPLSRRSDGHSTYDVTLSERRHVTRSAHVSCASCATASSSDFRSLAWRKCSASATLRRCARRMFTRQLYAGSNTNFLTDRPTSFRFVRTYHDVILLMMTSWFHVVACVLQLMQAVRFIHVDEKFFRERVKCKSLFRNCRPLQSLFEQVTYYISHPYRYAPFTHPIPRPPLLPLPLVIHMHAQPSHQMQM